MEPITKKQALEYELGSSWLPGLFSYPWYSDLVSTYIAYKVKIKYAKYRLSIFFNQNDNKNEKD